MLALKMRRVVVNVVPPVLRGLYAIVSGSTRIDTFRVWLALGGAGSARFGWPEDDPEDGGEEEGAQAATSVTIPRIAIMAERSR